eukprot:Opistho-2@38453
MSADAAPPVPNMAWDRAWSADEIKGNAGRWSLAGDAGMLLYLKDFSQRMTTRTHEIESQIDSFYWETEQTGARLYNIFNEFLLLSNTQFIENRVYEEEVVEGAQTDDKPADAQPEKTREQLEAEII